MSEKSGSIAEPQSQEVESLGEGRVEPHGGGSSRYVGSPAGW